MKFLIVKFALLFLTSSIASAEGEWYQWRGPSQDSHTAERDLPVEWNANDIAWKSQLPGLGQSTPILWGDRIFLTSATDRGATRLIMCLDRKDGSMLWQDEVWSGRPEDSHQMNGWASASCVSDGEHVYAFFGHGGGLFCYTLDGQPVWKKPLGEFAGPWGTAAAPLLVDNLVIQNCDADAPSNAVLRALDKRTGEQVWETDREDNRGWSTPVLIEFDGRRELVLNGDAGVRGYDVESGRELWFCRGFNGRGSPTATFAHGRLHIVNGKRGDVYAVKPGGRGDVAGSHMLWHTPRKSARDLPSPLVVGNQMLVVDMRGATLTSYDSTDRS